MAEIVGSVFIPKEFQSNFDKLRMHTKVNRLLKQADSKAELL